MAAPTRKVDRPPPRSDVPIVVESPPNRTRAIGDGFEAGAIGAAIVAIWFLIIDTVQGHPFYTPSLLGNTLSHGVDYAVQHQEVSVGMVYAYTGVHFVLFILFGIAVASLVIQYERTPLIGYLLVVLAVVFELGFLVFVLAFAKPLLEAIPWWGVLVGNLFALIAMGAYFVVRYPQLKEIQLPVD
jgi:hypothetical protein